MLYTLTTNPAIDMNADSQTMEANKVNRTTNAVYSPNGKGLNVSFVLKHYGIDSGILGFFGGFSGDYIVSECRKRGYRINAVEIAGTTRINMFLTVGGNEYKLVNNGPVVSAEEQEKMLETLASLQDMDVLTINGSAANGMAEDYYERILELCREKGVKTVLDISSTALSGLMRYRPYLIKPNDDEMKAIFGLGAENEEETIASLKKLHSLGAQNILLTMGEKGIYFYNGSRAYFCEAHPVRLKSSACAGDSCLAAFLSVWLKKPEKVEYALRLASATGASVAESDGLGDFANVERYLEKVRVYSL